MQYGIIHCVLLVSLLVANALTITSCPRRTWTPGSTGEELRVRVQLAERAKAAQDAAGKWIEVKPLDHPDNPYRDGYEEWDHWAWNNLLEEPFVRKTTAAQPENYLCLRTRIDESGYVVPHTVSTHEFMQAKADGKYITHSLNPRWVVSEGIIDPAFRRRFYDSGFSIRSSYYREVPTWLAEDPPIRAMLLPNGDVVTEGMLGENAKPQSERDCDGSWYCRYSIAGELLAKVKSAPWWYLFHNRDELGTPHGKMNIREDGYIWFSSEYTGELLSVWDFDGTRLPDTVPPQRSTLHFDWINAKLLETYYRVSNDAAPEQNT